ncbi:IpaD/SipD/SspD family type III secretion system needle tip protein, partial [Citrobacter freundii]|nr:IpaD/SipD/SspD family type III secretion system needle tip protein [Citrobacter freundii]
LIMNPVPWLQMTNMISYQGLVRTFLNEPPESDCRLYMVAEADGTYTLYVYPDLQPVRDGQDATFSLIGSDAGTSTAAEAPTASDIGLSPNDSRYYGNDGDEKSYSVISPSEDMVIVPMSTISSKNFYIPAGYTLITSRDTDDYKEYDCFLIPTSMLDPAETNSEAGNSNASVRLTESVVVLDKSYDMNGKGILSDKANIYVSPALTWDFEAHNSGEFATISSGMFNEWENSMNTMSSTVESQSQVMSEKLSQANTIFNNLTKVLSSTIEALLETQKEFLK